MNKFSTNNQEALGEKEEEIDLREVFFKYFRYWKWFIISIALALLIGVFVYMSADREYLVETSILLKEEKGGGGGSKDSPLGSLQELGLLSTTNNIDNEIAVYSSPNLMKQVILDLEIQNSYFVNGLFRDTEVYKNNPYYVRLENVKPDELKGFLKLKVSNIGGEGVKIGGIYTFQQDEFEFEGSVDKLPGFITLPAGLGSLYIAYRPDIDKDKREEEYTIYIQNAQRIAYRLVGELQIKPTTKSSSVLKLGLATQNVSKGIDVLNRLTEIYNKNNVQENNEIALNTSRFIDARLIDIAKELEDVEDDVVDYKKEQGITDISSEAKLFVEQSSEIEQRRLGFITQLKTIELVDDFVNNPNNSFKLAPTLGLQDQGLVAIIGEYNSLLLNYEKLDRSASEKSPALIKSFSEIESIRNSIKSSLQNTKSSMNISISELEKQIAKMSSRIHSVPTQERALLEIMRQQQIKQALYLYLMQVREETNITMASTADKAKVITDPIVPEYPNSPKRNILLLAALLIGCVVPVGVIYVKYRLEVSIADREELERLSNVSVIGEIMKKGDVDETIVVKPNSTTPIVELFRSLRNNVKFILDTPEKKVILVTSTIPGEGKTFVSVNLAASFALSDKKILLMGMDVRNPRLAVDMNFRKGAGLTSYLSGSEPDWKSLLVKLPAYPNMDVLQAGVVPPNPNELLMKKELNQLLDEARALYDIIIIDSAPVGVISDTFLISSLADTTVYVTREDVTPKNAISFINDMDRDNKLPNIYLVINGVKPSKNKGRYGRYGYGKTYGYGIEENK